MIARGAFVETSGRRILLGAFSTTTNEAGERTSLVALKATNGDHGFACIASLPSTEFVLKPAAFVSRISSAPRRRRLAPRKIYPRASRAR